MRENAGWGKRMLPWQRRIVDCVADEQWWRCEDSDRAQRDAEEERLRCSLREQSQAAKMARRCRRQEQRALQQHAEELRLLDVRRRHQLELAAMTQVFPLDSAGEVVERFPDESPVSAQRVQASSLRRQQKLDAFLTARAARAGLDVAAKGQHRRARARGGVCQVQCARRQFDVGGSSGRGKERFGGRFQGAVAGGVVRLAASRCVRARALRVCGVRFVQRRSGGVSRSRRGSRGGLSFCGRIVRSVRGWRVVDAGPTLGLHRGKCLWNAVLALCSPRLRARLRSTLLRSCRDSCGCGMSGRGASSSTSWNFRRIQWALIREGVCVAVEQISCVASWWPSSSRCVSVLGAPSGLLLGRLVWCLEEGHVYVVRSPVGEAMFVGEVSSCGPWQMSVVCGPKRSRVISTRNLRTCVNFACNLGDGFVARRRTN